jgi:DNA polymerase III alpha subunit
MSLPDFPNFPSVHVHQASFDSGSVPAQFAKREVELGTGALVNTDHGSLAASRQIYRLAKKNGLRPVLGIEAFFRDDDCPILAKHGIVAQPESKKPGAKQTVSHYSKYQHLTIHTLDQEAFETLVRLHSAANEHAERHGSESKPIFTWKDLEELGSKNVTFGSSCLVGMCSRHLLLGQPKIAVAYYERLRSIVKPGNFIVENFACDCSRNWVNAVFVKFGTSEHGICEDDRKFYDGKTLRIRWDGGVEELKASELAGKWDKWATGKKAMPKVELLAVKNYSTWAEEAEPLPIEEAKSIADFIQNECRPWCPDGDVQAGANRFMLLLAKKYKDPVNISDDSHFAYESERPVQDIRLFSMESDMSKGNAAKWRFFGSYHRQTSAEAFAHFQKTLGTTEDQFRGWVQNNIDWSKRFGWEFKDRKSLPAKFYPEDTLKHTMGLIKQVGRMDWSSTPRKERLAAELKMLHKNGVIDLLPYFALGQEVAELYEKNGRLTGVGRGSAAGLSLAYYLGITHVDPLRYGLSKERFLTESRIRSGKYPDIDSDLDSQDLLTGWEEPGMVVEMEDGSTKTVPKGQKVATSIGMMDIEQAFKEGLDILES